VLKAIVDWVCLNVIIFGAIMLNYLYTTFLHDVTVSTTQYLIQLMDRAGFEAHFVRFAHMALFEQDGVSDKDQVHSMAQIFDLVSVDAVLLGLIIVPMFFSAMHFFTAPFRKRYRSRVQILTAPLALVPFFFFTNIDVAILAALVLI